ncbi:MAG: poly-gamma-glutamate synthase PgsB [Stackebrandtia sp.]
MLFLYICLTLSCLALLVAGIVEQRRHDACLHSIPHRVLVNGIRGKSSITRLIAGALRGGDVRAVAKTTGTAARFIRPSGAEQPVYRKFDVPNVAEQIAVVRKAARHKPETLVVECMAIDPRLQEISQTKMIQSTIGVICNVREDHLEEMGPTLDDVARSLARSMPVGGICVTAERERLPILDEEARKRGCLLLSASPHAVTDEEMSRFPYVAFKENVSIALTVAGLLGVPRDKALDGMWKAAPDPGVLRVAECAPFGRRLRFANVMAANDPESTLMNIKQLLQQGAVTRPLYLVVNCRADRMERNAQMGALTADIAPERVILIGESTRTARVAVPGRWQDLVVDLGGRRAPQDLLADVIAEIPHHASLVAVGNIHGQGEALAQQLSHHPATQPFTSALPLAAVRGEAR